jgi:hypothetical protein
MKKGVAESDGVMKFFDGLTRVLEDHRKKKEAGYFEYRTDSRAEPGYRRDGVAAGACYARERLSYKSNASRT